MTDQPFAHFAPAIRQPMPLRQAITAAYRRGEAEALAPLIAAATLADPMRDAIADTTRALVSALRANRKGSGVEGLVQEYALSSQEGVALMCLAEALVRTPDSATAKQLITEKLQQGQWHSHLGNSQSFWVNASTWGLLLTGKAFRPAGENRQNILSQALRKIGGSLAHTTLHQAISLLGERFIYADSVSQALRTLADQPNTRATLDVIHNTAVTPSEAEQQFQIYQESLERLGRHATESEQSNYNLIIKLYFYVLGSSKRMDS